MTFDDLVIGTGQAGLPLATHLARSGRKVLVVERGAVGGTCVNVGCTPTKTIIASAAAAHEARTAGRLGVSVGEVKVDLAAVMDRKDKIVDIWRSGVEKSLRTTDGLTFVHGHARFVGPREIEVGQNRHRAERVFINVGARPAVPPLDGLDKVPWLDNARLLNLRELPKRLLVIGGGYIGCELGQAFRRFGAQVTMIDPGHHLLGREDEDVSEALEKAFRDEGIELAFGARAKSVARHPEGVAVTVEGGKTLTGSHLLIATGRRPNTEDLGCDKAGIQRDDRGFIVADDEYRTTAEGVFALGDCTAQPQFTHTSWDDHRILLGLLAGTSTRKRHDRTIPSVVFTDPQVAHVGLSEKEAKQKGADVEVAKMPFGDIARAQEVDRPAGMLKVLLDRNSGAIVGATFVGAEAGELLHILVPWVEARLPPRAIVDAEAAHPTYAEGVQSLLMKLERYRL